LIRAIWYGCWIGALTVVGACRDRETHVERDTTAAGVAGAPAAVVTRDTIYGDTAIGPAEIIRRYYDAIQKRDYDSAYALWGDSGKDSRQRREEFAAGFAQTAQVRVAIGDSVRNGAAAGSQYATVPVVINAVLRNGAKQHFTGTYTVRRAMVDGATLEQRRWHIYSAELHPR
jgi:hypothetical protein